MKNQLEKYEYDANETVNVIVVNDVYCKTIEKNHNQQFANRERIEVIYQAKNYIAPQIII